MSSVKQAVRQATLLLDRPGGRWLIARALPLLASRISDGVRALRYDKGWVHSFDEAVLVQPQPRLRSYDIGEARNRFLWGTLYQPKPGDTVIDVGAGLGSEAIYFGKRVGASGRVLAIEAHPIISEFATRSAELTGMLQVQVLNVALADCTKIVFIENDLNNHLGNAIGETSEGIPVQARNLDDICEEAGIDRVDFLKVNIEGAERLAIAGMENVISRTSVVSVSCHDFKYERTGNEFFRTKEIVDEFVRSRGFVVVPRSSSLPEIADQVNAFHPDRIDPKLLLHSDARARLRY